MALHTPLSAAVPRAGLPRLLWHSQCMPQCEGPRRMTALSGARFHQSRAGRGVRSTARRALQTAPVVTTARLATGDVPHLRRDWRTSASAPGLAHICAGTGAHLRRDWRTSAPGLAHICICAGTGPTSAPGLAHICAGTLPHMLGKVSAASHHPPRPAALVSTRSHRVCLGSALTSHHSLEQCHRGAVLASTH
jgi:hypothetical protein